MKSKRIVSVFTAALLLSCSCGSLMAETWKVPKDFPTIQAAIDDPSVQDGDTIKVKTGHHAGAIVTKAVSIKNSGHVVINDGPLLVPSRPFKVGFLFPNDGSGSGASITGFTFETDLAVFGTMTDGVTVANNRLNQTLQGITNWGGIDWHINNNRIHGIRTASTGGIGILIGDRFAMPGGIKGNIIANNKIFGQLTVAPDDVGGYNGAGIVLFADFRGSFQGAIQLGSNLILSNSISLSSDTPAVVDVSGIELSESTPQPFPVVIDNFLAKNHILWMDQPYFFQPDTIAFENSYFKNRPSVELPVPALAASFVSLDLEPESVVFTPIVVNPL